MFNSKLVQERRQKASHNINESEFYQFIYQDLIDRIKLLGNKFDHILVIDSINHVLFNKLLKETYSSAKIIHTANDAIKNINQKFDLIICPYSLHWESGIVKFLNYIKSMLSTNGIMICNFAGGGSLSNLRRNIVELESRYELPHCAHISPFVRFEDVASLLKNVGFNESIIDIEILNLEFETPLALMKNIKKYGESNALNRAINYSINKSMYYSLASEKINPFKDVINLVTFIAGQNKHDIKINS